MDGRVINDERVKKLIESNNYREKDKEILEDSSIKLTLKNYKKQALELCSKDNPSLKLTMFIKDLVKDLSNEEKLNLYNKNKRLEKLLDEVSKMYLGKKNLLTNNEKEISNLFFKYKTYVKEKIYEDDEEVGFFYSLGTYIKNSNNMNISNLYNKYKK